MKSRRPPILLACCLLASLACTTQYVPSPEPVSEAALAEALEWLSDPESEVELLEDGLLADVWLYERRRVVGAWGPSIPERRLTAALAPGIHYRKLLGGPKPDVFVAYASIQAVRAWTWPAWSAVELSLANVEPGAEPGPIVIRARDEASANRLSEAIDRLRRVRLLASTRPVAEMLADDPDPADAMFAGAPTLAPAVQPRIEVVAEPAHAVAVPPAASVEPVEPVEPIEAPRSLRADEAFARTGAGEAPPPRSEATAAATATDPTHDASLEPLRVKAPPRGKWNPTGVSSRSFRRGR